MKTIAEFDLLISNEVIGLYLEGERDFLKWREGNYSQACCLSEYRKEFHPLDDEAFGATVTIEMGETARLKPHCVCAIQVPFRVPSNQMVTVFSVQEECEIGEIPAGDYDLVYQVALDEEVSYHLQLVSPSPTSPKFLLHDADLVPGFSGKFI